MSRLATRLRRIGFTYRYGLPVRFQLLSTPPLNDAVTFSYGDVARPGADFHRADTTPLRAHSPQRKLGSSSLLFSRGAQASGLRCRKSTIFGTSTVDLSSST